MADTIIGAHDGTFKTEGSISMRETQEFLALREGLSAASFESPGLAGSISLQKLYDASNAGEIVLAGNAAYPSSNYSLGGLRGSSYQNNTAPVINLLGPNVFFVNNTVTSIRPDTLSDSLTMDSDGRIYAVRVWIDDYSISGTITGFGGPNGENATSGTNNAGSPWGITAATAVQSGRTSFYYHFNDASDTIIINNTYNALIGQYNPYGENVQPLGLLVPPGWSIEIFDRPNLGGTRRYYRNGPVYFYDRISSSNYYMNPATYNYSQHNDWYYYMRGLTQVGVGHWGIHRGYNAGTIRYWHNNLGSFSEPTPGYSYRLQKIAMPN